ncbi:MAG TPA: hypothetical protein VGD35_13555, partial [Chitinophaga sp.]
MQGFIFYITFIGSLLFSSFNAKAADDSTVVLLTAEKAHARIQYGAAQLSKALTTAGYKVRQTSSKAAPKNAAVIIIGLLEEERLQ